MPENILYHFWLLIDGREVKEAYVKYSCDWQMSPLKVSPGSIFVVGDNRDRPEDMMVFGEAPIENILGRVVL